MAHGLGHYFFHVKIVEQKKNDKTKSVWTSTMPIF